MRNIEFVSYDGKYPNLCSGTLTLLVDGNIWSGDNYLFSGGECYIDQDTQEEIVKTDQWEVDQGKFLEEGFELEEITLIESLVNQNVPYGCCGGCI